MSTLDPVLLRLDPSFGDLGRAAEALSAHPGRRASAPSSPCLHALRAVAASPSSGERVVVLEASGPHGADERPPISVSEPTPLARVRDAGASAIAGPRRLALLPLPDGPGLRGALRRALAAVHADPAGLAVKDVVPVAVRPSDVSDADAAARAAIPLEWSPLLPAVSYVAPIRAAWRDLVRALQPARRLRFSALENAAVLGFLPGERPGDAPRGVRPHRGRRAAILAVDGIDGAGKSTQLAALRDALSDRGLRVALLKPFRRGVFHDALTDAMRLCRRGDRLHLWRVERVAKAFDSVKFFATDVAPLLDTHDVLLFDRWIWTHFAFAAARLHDDPGCRTLLSVYPPADRVWILDLSADEALRRVAARGVAPTIDEHRYMLERVREALLDLADRHGGGVIAADRPFEDIRDLLIEEASAVLGRRAAGGGI